MISVEGYAIDGDDMHYVVECPHCEHEQEWTGFFDSTDIFNCPKCHGKFYVNRIWIDEDQYID